MLVIKCRVRDGGVSAQAKSVSNRFTRVRRDAKFSSKNATS